MPILPPKSVYPLDYDTDYTLFKVYNTTESTLSSDLGTWATTININPVDSSEDEIWADNGYATLSGELIYYDDVQKDTNQKINALINCVRNLGGKPPQFNESGTSIRGFVLAEHHNSLARATVNLENFVGINFSTDKATLDWRIRNLNQAEFVDDYGCPQVNFIYYITNIDPLLGTTITYSLEIIGVYDSFILEFGDTTLTTTETSGIHIYPPNTTIDPTVTVYSAVCQTVNSGPSRTQPNEPLLTVVPTDQNITIDPISDFPDLQYITDPNTSADVNLPPIVFPCLDIGPFGPINIPSTIILDPPVIVPSQVVFSNVPVIASTVSISPVNIDVIADQFVELVCVPLGSGSGGAVDSKGAVGGLNFSGYSIGGAAGNTATTSADKVAYKTDAVSSIASAALPTGFQRSWMSVTANSTHGYMGGGGGAANSGYVSSFFRIAFATEITAAYTTVSLSSANNAGAGLSYGNTAGYYTGGAASGTVVNKLVYSTATMTSPATAQLNPGRYAHTGVSNQTEKGYLSGGITGSLGQTSLSTTLSSLLIYSSDTFSAKTTDDLKASRQRHAGTDGNNSQGYVAGGNSNTLSNVLLKSIEKMHYPSDSTVAMYITLSSGKVNLGGLNEGSSKGYFLGGGTAYSSSATTNNVETIHYLNDTIFAVPGTLSQAKNNMACVSRVYLGTSSTPAPSPTPTPAPAFTMNEIQTITPNIPQFISIRNGYVVPEEAGKKTDDENNFYFSQNGYVPTPDNAETEIKDSYLKNTIKNAMQDSFKTMKLMIKDNQILPDMNELLGE